METKLQRRRARIGAARPPDQKFSRQDAVTWEVNVLSLSFSNSHDLRNFALKSSHGLACYTTLASTNYSWFLIMTLISLPLRTASNASRLSPSVYFFVIKGLTSTTPRASMSIAFGKQDAVYLVMPENGQLWFSSSSDGRVPFTSSSLAVTAIIGKTLVSTCPKPTAMSTLIVKSTIPQTL